MGLALRTFGPVLFTGFLVDFLAIASSLTLSEQMGDAGRPDKDFVMSHKKLGRGTLGYYPGAAAFALFIGYVLSECSGVTEKI